MLKISLTEIVKKNNLVLKQCTLQLPVNKAVVLRGDKDTVTAVFKRILCQKDCFFSLDNDCLETKQLEHTIILLSFKEYLPLTKKVSALFCEIGCKQEQCMKRLHAIQMESKYHKRVCQLTKEERMLLSLQLACAKNPSLLMLDKDWTTCSSLSQEMIKEILNEYVQNGGFLFVAQGAERLIANSLVYEIVEQTLCCDGLISNFLEEKGEVKINKRGKQTTREYLRGKVLATCGNVIYYVLATVLVSTALLTFFAFSFAIDQLENEVNKIKNSGYYTVGISVCGTGGEYNACNSGNVPLSTAQLNIMDSIEEIKHFQPVHTMFFNHGNGKEGTQMALLADGETIYEEVGGSVFNTVIRAYDESMFSIDTATLKTSDVKEGIYISKVLQEENKEVFQGMQDREIELQATLDIPLYIERVKVQNYEMNGESEKKEFINQVIRPFVVTLPVLGVVDDTVAGWYLDEQVFLRIQKEAMLTYPKDSVISKFSDSESIEEYMPFEYTARVDKYEDISIVQTKMKNLDSTMSLRSDIQQREQFVQYTKENQLMLKSNMFPVLMLLFVSLCVFLLVSCFIQKRSFMYAFQFQNINRKWKVSFMKKIGISFVLTGVFSFVFITIFSMDSFHNFIMTHIYDLTSSGSTYEYSESITLLYSFLQALSSLKMTVALLACGFTLSLCISILRYIPAIHSYYKVRKLL